MVLLIYMVVQTLADLIFGLLLPSVLASREAKRYDQCVGNLKRIGLAMQEYHQKYGRFPPSFVPGRDGKPMHSWRVLLLPFLDEKELYANYRLDEPWNGPHNIALAERMPAVYRCPSDYSADHSQTSYAMIVGPHAISDGPTSRRIRDIKDGGSKTIMVAEAANAGIKWTEPRDLNAKDMTFVTHVVKEHSRGYESDIASRHGSGRTNVLFCDGIVNDVNDGTEEKVLRAMMTID